MSGFTSENADTAMIVNYRFFEQTKRARDIVVERKWSETLTVTASTNYACRRHVIDLIHYFVGPVARPGALKGGADA